MQSAKLEVTLADWQALQSRVDAAEADTRKIREELVAARAADPQGRIMQLAAFSRDCLTITRFAVANCPPEVIKGWPHEALTRIAANIDALPDAGVDERDMALDLINFANDAKALEIRRKAEYVKPTPFTDEELAAKRAEIATDPMGQIALDRIKEAH